MDANLVGSARKDLDADERELPVSEEGFYLRHRVFGLCSFFWVARDSHFPIGFAKDGLLDDELCCFVCLE